MNWYELSRQFFDFSFEHHECGVYHTAIYMLAIEQNNRYGWKKEFWFPTAYNCDVLGIGNRNTYLSALKDLVDWWFIEIICESKNQFKATVISLCHIKIDIATDTAWYTALDKALIWQGIWHWYAIDTIDKQVNNETTKPRKKKQVDATPKNPEDTETPKTEINQEEWTALLEWEETFTSIMAQALIDIGWKPKETVQEFVEWVKKKMEVNKIEECEKDFYKLKSWLSWFVDHFKDKSTKNHKSTLWANFCLQFNLK